MCKERQVKLGGGWAAKYAVFDSVFPERYPDPGLCNCYPLDLRGPLQIGGARGVKVSWCFN